MVAGRGKSSDRELGAAGEGRARESMFPRDREEVRRMTYEGTVLPKHLKREREKKKAAVKVETKLKESKIQSCAWKHPMHIERRFPAHLNLQLPAVLSAELLLHTNQRTHYFLCVRR